MHGLEGWPLWSVTGIPAMVEVESLPRKPREVDLGRAGAEGCGGAACVGAELSNKMHSFSRLSCHQQTRRSL